MTRAEFMAAAPLLEANAVRPRTADGYGEWEYTLAVDLLDGWGRRSILGPGRADPTKSGE